MRTVARKGKWSPFTHKRRKQLFGETITTNKTVRRKTTSGKIGNGDAYVMPPGFQEWAQHALELGARQTPKAKRAESNTAQEDNTNAAFTFRHSSDQTRRQIDSADGPDKTVHVIGADPRAVLLKWTAPEMRDGEKEFTFDSLLEEVGPALKREVTRMFGKTYDTGRDSVTLALTEETVGKVYKFSGVTNELSLAGDLVRKLGKEMARVTGFDYDHVHVLRYGSESKLGWHSDDEALIRPGTAIAGVSFFKNVGGCKTFKMRPKLPGKGKRP